MVGNPAIELNWKLPFAEQSAYFKQKLLLPSEKYSDLEGRHHDRAFVVAGAMKADLLSDLHGAVQKAIDSGTTLATFRKDFELIVAKHGWTGWTGEDTADGRAWRTKVIYETNLRTSHAAGRFQQMRDPEVLKARPYWQWVHRSLEHPRLQHLAWNGLTLPADSPWWSVYYPPCAWGCQCTVIALSAADLERLGINISEAPAIDYVDAKVGGKAVSVAKGTDYGWDHAHGENLVEDALQIQAGKLENYPVGIARANTNELLHSDLFKKFFAGEIHGEWPIAVLKPSEMQVLGAESPVILLSQESLATHLGKHPEIGFDDYFKIQKLLDEGDVWKQSDERLVYLTLDKVMYKASLKRTQDGKKNYFLSLFKVRKEKPPKGAVQIR